MSKRVLTTESGAPVADHQNSASAGIGGPLLLQDQHLLEKLARFNRERIPVGAPPTPLRQWGRVVHARGSGGYGHFEVTDDVTGFTCADFLASVGERTEVFVRFSTVADSLGGADAVRDPRGFAVKFYTAESNYDLVGNNTPVFFVKDPVKFPDFIHSQKRDPFTGRQEPDNVWDFWAHAPEATHQVTWLMGERGIPASYRRMNGYGSYAYQWANAEGEAFFVKYHFKTNQGVRSLSSEQAAEPAGKDPKATTAQNYGRDGLMAANARGRHAKNYEPNSYDGPVETGRPRSAPLAVTGHTGTHEAPLRTKDDDFFQAGELYRLMSAEERQRLVANIAGGLSQVTRDDVIEKNLAHFHAADPEYGRRVAEAVRALRED
ncbi:catalase [Streptomyces sp. NPDC002172]